MLRERPAAGARPALATRSMGAVALGAGSLGAEGSLEVRGARPVELGSCTGAEGSVSHALWVSALCSAEEIGAESGEGGVAAVPAARAVLTGPVVPVERPGAAGLAGGQVRPVEAAAPAAAAAAAEAAAGVGPVGVADLEGAADADPADPGAPADPAVAAVPGERAGVTGRTVPEVRTGPVLREGATGCWDPAAELRAVPAVRVGPVGPEVLSGLEALGGRGGAEALDVLTGPVVPEGSAVAAVLVSDSGKAARRPRGRRGGSSGGVVPGERGAGAAEAELAEAEPVGG